MAHESEINRLNESIQIRQQLYDNDNLSDQECEQLAIDVGRRFFLQMDLDKLKRVEWIYNGAA